MIKGVGHAAIAVSDLNRSIEFYRDKLGFALVRSFERADGARVVDLSKDPSQIGEMQLICYPSELPPDKREPNHLGLEHIGLLIDDLDATYEELKARGVTDFIREPTPARPNRPRTAMFLDPDGVRLELITFVQR